MDNPFDTVKDSSIWYTQPNLKAVSILDNRIYFGIVREARNDQNFNELRYLVEIRHKNDVILTNCRMMRRWGGAFNYEDYVLQGYTYNKDSNSQNGFAAIPGDIVIVANLGGQAREGVILGGLTHRARKSFLDITKGPQYKSEFNGIETSINEDGEWILTFKGQPTNLDKLKDTPDQPVPEPEYDKDVGTSYIKWDKSGSFTIDDNATDGDKIQRLFIDKKNGAIQIDSGKVSLKFTKKDQAVILICKTSENDSSESITYKTKKFEGQADDHIHLKTPKYVVESDKIRLGEEGASDWLILGTTFRREQKIMDNTLVAQFTAAAVALGLAGTQLTTAGTQLTTAGAQITAAGGIAAAVPPLVLIAAPLTGAGAATTGAGAATTAAATAIIQAQTALQQVMVAIQLFETNGAVNDYLSQVSKTK